MSDLITDNLMVSGIIGFFAPAIIPVVFGWIERATGKPLGKKEKKVVILSIAFFVVFLVSFISYEWTNYSWDSIKNYLGILFANYGVVLGMVNTVYTMIVKLFPSIDQKLETLERLIAK